jgi:hypothetical protein
VRQGERGTWGALFDLSRSATLAFSGRGKAGSLPLGGKDGRSSRDAAGSDDRHL